jgi:hypothetical protein
LDAICFERARFPPLAKTITNARNTVEERRFSAA